MIPESVVRELRYIEVTTARRMRTLAAGPFTSRRRGDGFDFDRLEPYRPGDDVRRIDWNVTARLDSAFIRRTHAERELNVIVAVDVSRSMDLGTSHRSKREAMMLVTASLVFSAAASQAAVGFLAFSDGIIAWDQPRRGRAAAWAALERCWAARGAPGRTTLLPALRCLLARLKRMSLICLVSDFQTDEDPCTGPEFGMLAARHDVIAIVPEDPLERALPGGFGYITVRDVESGQRAALDLGARSRRDYAAEAALRRRELVRRFYRASMEHVFVQTDEPVIEPLMTLFASRVRR
jgi:uncharacterized protein (DUF58 family)